MGGFGGFLGSTPQVNIKNGKHNSDACDNAACEDGPRIIRRLCVMLVCFVISFFFAFRAGDALYENRRVLSAELLLVAILIALADSSCLCSPPLSGVGGGSFEWAGIGENKNIKEQKMISFLIALHPSREITACVEKMRGETATSTPLTYINQKNNQVFSFDF